MSSQCIVFDICLFTFSFADESSVVAWRSTGNKKFDFGFYKFVFVDESTVAAERSTGH